MITGFVPSYELDSGIGKKIAGFKNLDEGWHYPTFLLYYIRNPGPLLLFDEIVVDKGAAKKAVDYVTGFDKKTRDYEGRLVEVLRPTESEGQVFKDLIESKLFRREEVVNMITDTDFRRIRQGYNRDAGFSAAPPSDFINAIAVMKNRYGTNYASPDPESFETMNINVTWVLSEKLSAIPLDDVLRSPLYEYKAMQLASLGTEAVSTAYDMIKQARQVLYLPNEPLRNIDAFLTLHKDPRVGKFREKVRNLSNKRATPQEISREIFDANSELRELGVDEYSLVVGLIGSMVGLIAAQWNFATGISGTASSLLLVGKELRKIWKTKRYEWLETVKGLCEI